MIRVHDKIKEILQNEDLNELFDTFIIGWGNQSDKSASLMYTSDEPYKILDLLVANLARFIFTEIEEKFHKKYLTMINKELKEKLKNYTNEERKDVH